MALRKYMVLFQSGAGVSCEAEDQEMAVQGAKAEQRCLNREKRISSCRDQSAPIVGRTA